MTMDPVRKQEEEDYNILKLQTMKTQKRIHNYHKKHSRRTVKEMEHEHVCPYRNCVKAYGCEASLNLHIKVKHNGGNKCARETLALKILKAHL